jgi:hypothetical protein
MLLSDVYSQICVVHCGVAEGSGLWNITLRRRFVYRRFEGTLCILLWPIHPWGQRHRVAGNVENSNCANPHHVFTF